MVLNKKPNYVFLRNTTIVHFSTGLADVVDNRIIFAGGSTGKKNEAANESSLVSRSLIYQAGETANLPCDISVPSNPAPNDELMLIMWYREDVRSPIYSIGMDLILRVKSA